MFAKLLKQEWRGSRKVIGLLCAVILISGVIIGTTALAMTKWGSLGDSDVAATLALLLVMACVIAVALSCAASIVYVLCRFYRSRFTEEGYLTYTLPVSNHSLMLSSILMSAAEMLLVLVAAAVAVMEAFGIFALALPWQEVGPDTWNAFRETAACVFRSLGENAGVLGQAIAFVVLMGLSELMELMLAVTVGGMAAKKHPVLMAVLVYYGLEFVRLLVMVTKVMRMEPVLAATNVVSLVVIVGGYFLIYWLTDKKLNLA